ncbi:competence family protein [Rickettsia amblyommatis str. Ac/Pa]|uniref:Competence family protein n=1 Tax=Rickettsia amblyommatis str. Ac/Pa TaxID=1359164 RepID=A0A0F3N046_RICAM|nr:competence family protein [Rickettsia amblyommatis str. Ac/Pa]
MQDMRQSGISHVLCVSGLHLSLVVMIIFLTTRFLLNLSNYLTYNFNIKLISAYCSLIGSFGYLELSGMQRAATRAFITAAIFIYGIIYRTLLLSPSFTYNCDFYNIIVKSRIYFSSKFPIIFYRRIIACCRL